MAAEYDHLPVYKAAYDLLQHVYRDKCIASVPRDVKYTLVERLKQDILEVLVLIYKAHYNMLGDKALQLQQARELIPGVNARMRIMYDLRYINLELFRTLAVEVESVSKQLGAWHTKTLRRRIVAPPAPAPARTAASVAAPAPVAAQTAAQTTVAAQTAAPVAASAPADPFAAPAVAPVAASVPADPFAAPVATAAPAATRPVPTDPFAAPAPAATTRPASVAASVPADPFAAPAPAATRPAPAPRSARTDLFAAPAPAAAAPFPAPDPLASPAPEAPWAAPGEDNE